MFLLDTNIISDAKRGHAPVTAWIAANLTSQLYLSVLTIGEIEKGARSLSRRNPADAERLFEWLRHVRDSYQGRILPISEPISLEWGRIAAVRTRSVIDGLIAATAIVHELTVVTRNVADFGDTGVRIVNPWDGWASANV